MHVKTRHPGAFASACACLLIWLAACAPSDAVTPDTEAVKAPTAAPAAAATPPAPAPFEGRDTVSVAELFRAVADELPNIARSESVRADYRDLIAAHRLSDSEALYDDYVRVRVAFEATRAGGLWGLEWRITDQLPQSDRIWAQWRAAKVGDDALPATTAIAECDELSALFAVVAHGIGLSRRSQVGLLWPTSNHTVAVWTIVHDGGRQTRVVVPTSQIFLDSAQSLDTRAFDPWAQKQVFDYRRRDIAMDAPLPSALARHLVTAIRRHGGASRGALQGMRNRREYDQRMAAAAARERTQE